MTNGRFRIMLAHHHSPYRQSFALAALVLLALFVFFPPFEFQPYELQAEEFEVVEVQPHIEIPKPPAEPSPPPPTIDPTLPGDGVDEIPETVVDRWEDVVVSPRRPQSRRVFIVYDQLPEPEYIARPAYPPLAREAGIEGTVVLKVRIGLDHRVHDAVVLRSDVTPAMERAGVAAALKCRYKPARQGTVEVEVWVPIVIHFRLNHALER
jgi:protein TonB